MSTPPCPHELADPRMCPRCRRGLIVIAPNQPAVTALESGAQPLCTTRPGRVYAGQVALWTAEELRQSSDPKAAVWADALEWFSRCVQGGPADFVSAQRKLMAAFGVQEQPYEPVDGAR